MLGPQLQLIGIGVDPLTLLSPAQHQRWQALGGQTVVIGAASAASDQVWADVDNSFGAREPGKDWLIAVRPDKVVMADGAPSQADAIVAAVAQLLS